MCPPLQPSSALSWTPADTADLFCTVFFDAPDSYVGAGNNGYKFWEYDPSLMREGITDVRPNTKAMHLFTAA